MSRAGRGLAPPLQLFDVECCSPARDFYLRRRRGLDTRGRRGQRGVAAVARAPAPQRQLPRARGQGDGLCVAPEITDEECARAISVAAFDGEPVSLLIEGDARALLVAVREASVARACRDKVTVEVQNLRVRRARERAPVELRALEGEFRLRVGEAAERGLGLALAADEGVVLPHASAAHRPPKLAVCVAREVEEGRAL